MAVSPVLVIKIVDGSSVGVRARWRDDYIEHEIVLNSVLAYWWANDLPPVLKFLELFESVIKRTINELTPHKDLKLKYDVKADDVTGLLRLALSSLEIIAGEKNYILVMADAGQILEILGENFNPQIIECISGKNIHGLKELNVSKKLIGLCGLNGNAENSLPFLRNDTADIIRKLPQKHLRVDFSVADNLRYYNGIVFKGFIDGVPEAVISGGEYNIMGVKGAGFAVYLDFTGKYHD